MSSVSYNSQSVTNRIGSTPLVKIEKRATTVMEHGPRSVSGKTETEPAGPTMAGKDTDLIAEEVTEEGRSPATSTRTTLPLPGLCHSHRDDSNHKHCSNKLVSHRCPPVDSYDIEIKPDRQLFKVIVQPGR